MRVWYCRPEHCTAHSPVWFVLHGARRNAPEDLDIWTPLARAHGALLVVPEFSRTLFPGARAYNLGNIVVRNGRLRSHRRWSLRVIDEVFDRLKASGFGRHDSYALFGHSAGAQFVHRYATFVRSPRVQVAVAANAGWYTFPDPDVAFPYGLRHTGLGEDDLHGLLAAPLVIMLGMKDGESDTRLQSTPEAVAQGANRLERGRRYYATGREVALRLGSPFRWRLVQLVGTGHDDPTIAHRAAELLASRDAAATIPHPA